MPTGFGKQYRTALVTPGKSRNRKGSYRHPGDTKRSGVGSGGRFNSHAVIHWMPQALLAAQVFLGRLHRHLSKQELDLLQFAA